MLTTACFAVLLAAGAAFAAACGTVLDIPETEPSPAGADGAAPADGATTTDGATSTTAEAGADAGASLDGGKPKIVFVTTGTRTGAMGGVVGGDGLCAAEAADARLGGSFVAYLQTQQGAAGHPATRVGNTGFARVDGTRVFDGNPQGAAPKQPLDLTAAGVVLPAGERVWTGIYNGPSAICGDTSGLWTTTNPAIVGAGTGDPKTTASGWSQGMLVDCNVPLHLYCFEK